jgi:M6 family metalloprotease-like protein
MSDYFNEVSYGKLTISTTFYPSSEGNAISTYVDSHPRSYFQEYNSTTNPTGYSGSDQKKEREFTLLKKAVLAVKDQIPSDLNVDFNNDGIVDNVCFIVQGDTDGWSDLLWPHMWSLTDDYYVTINEKQVITFNFQIESYARSSTSVLCHEMFHTIGAPDLYHYTTGTSLHPVGNWDIMEYNTEPAQSMGAYMKYKYGGWIESIPEISKSGTYTISPLDSSNATNLCYKIPIANSSSGEFIVLEYRKQGKVFESVIPGTGLLIYRIWPYARGNMYFNGTDILDEVYVYRPDGSANNNGDYETAFFSDKVYRTSFSKDITNPSCLLSDGTIGNITITNVMQTNDGNISFRVVLPGDDYLFPLKENFTLSSTANVSSSVSIETNVDSWTCSSSADWLEAIKSEDATKISFRTISENLSLDNRDAIITISSDGLPDSYVYVKQKGSAAFLTVDTRTQTVWGSTGATAEYKISTNLPSWEVSYSVSWISVDKNVDNGTVTVKTLSANTGNAERQAIIKVTAGSLQVNLIFIQDIYTGVDQMSSDGVKIFPNPSQGLFYVCIEGNTSGIATIKIYNILGNLVDERELFLEGNSKQSIKLNAEPSGVYLLKIKYGSKTITRKLMINSL